MLDVTEVERAFALSSFQNFCRIAYKKSTGQKLIIARPHRVLIDTLQEVIDGKHTRVIINMPPRYGKTLIAVKYFIAYGLAINASSKYIHLSYADSLALDNSEAVKDIIQSEWYQELFPEVKIKKDSKAKDKWYTDASGGVLARSSSGQVTGFGAGSNDEGFTGAIIIDDPLKPDDAMSAVLRDKVNLRFETTIRSRTNSKKTPIIVIMQRLNREDLTGYLLTNEPDVWHHVNMPVIIDGLPLWEEKHSLDDLAALRDVNKWVFETQYMQNPLPMEGQMFIDLKRYRTFDNKLSIGKLAYIDVADTGKDSHCVVFGEIVENRIYIVDVLMTKLGTEHNVDMTAAKINEHKPRYVRIESNMGGAMYYQLLSPKVSQGITLIPIKNMTNKHSRITQMTGMIKTFCYFREDYERGSDYDLFMRELDNYTADGGAAHDDAPDALEGLMSMIMQFHAQLFK
jgi:predicted phage terminase large subunit-like protein